MTLDVTGIQTDFNNILGETGERAVLYSTTSGLLNNWGEKTIGSTLIGSITILVQNVNKDLMRKVYGGVPDYSATGYVSSGNDININDIIITSKTSYEVGNVQTHNLSGLDIYQILELTNYNDK